MNSKVFCFFLFSCYQVLQIDEIKVKLSALKAVFDQLLLFGIEPFKAKKGNDSKSETEETDAETTEETEEETATAHNLLQLLSGFLDHEVSNQYVWRINRDLVFSVFLGNTEYVWKMTNIVYI